ncbi:paraquat-inducible protein A [Pelagimonas varians]|uniref:Paraquat-inducible protein A n=1 Tax=Pelagimonas varians TaxID=696760 RepID=A0A238L6R3_9RHOB|nr:paraquat-inducible protein A [Pelagimonas varians]PYG26393.1 paraquat-inducible protein A [Pelagimonas varians]SMX49996.1 Paraquat-inducible protein A [Pelagimonas varians]
MIDSGIETTARQQGLVACTHCSRVWPTAATQCQRCGAKLTSRDARSLSRVWAWWMLGLICYIPANIYPMLETKLLFKVSGGTIVGGAVELFAHGAVAVALVILLASVAIPLAKFGAIAYLALSVQQGWQSNQHRRMQIYEVVEFVGRWSMIDVFVVAVLSSLVQLGSVVSISPGPASLTFALSVVCTMLAARSFDSRLIWDSIAKHDTNRDQVFKP